MGICHSQKPLWDPLWVSSQLPYVKCFGASGIWKSLYDVLQVHPQEAVLHFVVLVTYLISQSVVGQSEYACYVLFNTAAYL